MDDILVPACTTNKWQEEMIAVFFYALSRREDFPRGCAGNHLGRSHQYIPAITIIQRQIGNQQNKLTTYLLIKLIRVCVCVCANI